MEDLNLSKKTQNIVKSLIESKSWFSDKKNKYIKFNEFNFGGTFSYYPEDFKNFCTSLSSRFLNK